MRTTQSRRDIRPLLIGCLALAACQRHDTPPAVVVVPANAIAAAPVPIAPTPMPSASPSAIPTIAASPPGPNPQLTRAPFRSPPLPPELTNDNGLIPLPPRPPASAFGGGEQH